MSDSENVILVEVEAERESPVKSTVEARGFEVVIDEPEEDGGTDEGPHPLEYLLASQAGCLNITATQIANEMELTLETLYISISGELDVAAFLTEQPDERPAVRNIDVTLEAETPEDEEVLQEWGERVEERCPVTNNMKYDTNVDLSVDRMCLARGSDGRHGMNS